MDTSSFDKQAQSHLSFYHGFMNGVKIVVVLIILTLVNGDHPSLEAGDRQQKGRQECRPFCCVVHDCSAGNFASRKKKAISTAAVSGASEP